MKRHMVLFKDANYLSLSNGGSQVYLHEESLCDTLGMADYILLHFMGFYQSAATARAKIVVYQSAKPGLRPKDVNAHPKPPESSPGAQRDRPTTLPTYPGCAVLATLAPLGLSGPRGQGRSAAPS